MSENSTFSANELLRLFLTAPSEAESAKILDRLFEKHAFPLIAKVLTAKFSAAKNDWSFSEQDYEDLRGECALKIVGALRARKSAPDEWEAINDFAAYCAAIAYNCWNAFVRERSPNRESLKNKIRYSLDKDSRFASKTVDDGEVFYRQGRNSEVSPMSSDLLMSTVKDANEFFAPSELPDLLDLIFEKAGGGLKIEIIVKIVASLWQVRDFPAVSLDDFHERAAPSSPAGTEKYEMRRKLEYFWREIRVLPILQRVALLYNLRDEHGGEMLLLFFNTRIASLDELAEAMNLSKMQFAELLPHLPFDDRKIAAAMNLTAKQIGNLRKVARDNLRRRLDGKKKRKSRAQTAEVYLVTGSDENDAASAGEFLN